MMASTIYAHKWYQFKAVSAVCMMCVARQMSQLDAGAPLLALAHLSSQSQSLINTNIPGRLQNMHELHLSGSCCKDQIA